MRLFSKLVGAWTIFMSGFATLGLGGCFHTPNGSPVQVYIQDYPKTGKDDYNISKHTFNGTTKDGDFLYWYAFHKVAVSFLNLINLRYQTKTTDPPLPHRLYDSAIMGRDTQDQVADLQKDDPSTWKTWRDFLANYNDTSVGYSFDHLDMSANSKIDPKKTYYGTYQNLALIPDINVIRDQKKGQKYFKNNKFDIQDSRKTLVIFSVVKKALDNLNENVLNANAGNYQSSNQHISQNARTAFVRIGQIQADMEFVGRKKFHLTTWFNNLVAKLTLTSWSFDGKNFCQGWVFDGFDFYDYDYSSQWFPSDFKVYHQVYPFAGNEFILRRLILGYHDKPTPDDPTAPAKGRVDHSSLPYLTNRGRNISSYPEYRCGVVVDSLWEEDV